MSTNLERALAAWRDEGPRVFGLKFASALGARRLLLLERTLAAPIVGAADSVRLDFGLLPDAGVDAYGSLRPEANRQRILDRWRRGDRCCVARAAGAIVACCWVATRNAWTEHLDAAVPLAPGDVYLFDAWTAPSQRGRGVAQALCLWQLEALRQEGLRRAVRATAIENVAARRLHAACGFRPFGSMTRVALGPWRRVTCRLARAAEAPDAT